MKTKLLAILLMITTVHFFANDISTHQQKSNRVELLAHLKMVKEETENLIQELTIGVKTMQTNYAYGKKNYFFCLNMINEIDQQLNNPIKNKVFSESALNTSIELLCNDMKTMNDIINIINTNINLLHESLSLFITENNQTDIVLLESIFTKHHTQYCQNNPDGDFIQMQFTELWHSDILTPFFVSSAVEWYSNLLKKINAKIAELTINL